MRDDDKLWLTEAVVPTFHHVLYIPFFFFYNKYLELSDSSSFNSNILSLVPTSEN